MEKRPLSRLERIKLEKDKYPGLRLKNGLASNTGKALQTSEKAKKVLSEKSINLIADALKLMLKE